MSIQSQKGCLFCWKGLNKHGEIMITSASTFQPAVQIPLIVLAQWEEILLLCMKIVIYSLPVKTYIWFKNLFCAINKFLSDEVDDEDNVFSETEVKGYQSLRLQMTALSMLWNLSLFTDSLQGEIFFNTSVTRYRNDQLINSQYVCIRWLMHTYIYTYIYTHTYVCHCDSSSYYFSVLREIS